MLLLYISSSAIIPDIACFDEDGSRFVNERLRSGTLDEQELAMKVALLGKEDLSYKASLNSEPTR